MLASIPYKEIFVRFKIMDDYGLKESILKISQSLYPSKEGVVLSVISNIIFMKGDLIQL